MADFIIVNVGGVIYCTTSATINRLPDSLFSQSDDVARDDEDRIFIDGDGTLFRFVLNFLRWSVLALPEDFKEFDMLKEEARFYKIQPLIDAIDARQRRPSERRIKIESLEMIQLPDGFKLRGEKGTVDNIITKGKDAELEMHITDNSIQVETLTDSDYIEMVADGLDMSQITKLVPKVRKIIFDLGFAPKNCNLNGHDGDAWLLFER